MSSDPHAPTPAGPDPDQTAEIDSTVVEPPPADAPEPESDWLRPDDATSAATPAPDPLLSTPSAFTPPGTPETGDGPSPLEQAKAVTDRPEVMVGLAFVGGAVVSFVLKRFRR